MDTTMAETGAEARTGNVVLVEEEAPATAHTKVLTSRISAMDAEAAIRAGTGSAHPCATTVAI